MSQYIYGAGAAYVRCCQPVSLRRKDGTTYPLLDLYKASGAPSLLDILHNTQLTRLGHVMRMPNTSVVKQLMFAKSLIGGLSAMAQLALYSVAWADKHGWMWGYAKAQNRAA